MDLQMYLLIWVCVFGLCLGSFYNVVILRSISGESIVFPPSKCPKCNNKLYWWHNIPILSYIILRGKCYFCKEHISIQYPIVEFISMTLFGFSFLKFGISYETLFLILWLSLLLIMTATDLKEQLVDCNLAITMGISGTICAFLINGWQGVISSVFGLLAGIIIFESIARIGKLCIKTEVIGEADTYVAAAIGAVFGIYNLPIILLIGLFTYALIFVPLYLYDKFRLKDYQTCVTSIFFIMSVVLSLSLLKSYVGLILLLVSAVLFTVSMFNGLDKKVHRRLPYLPAFSIGVILFIIFFVNNELVYNNSILADIIIKMTAN